MPPTSISSNHSSQEHESIYDKYCSRLEESTEPIDGFTISEKGLKFIKTAIRFYKGVRMIPFYFFLNKGSTFCIQRHLKFYKHLNVVAGISFETPEISDEKLEEFFTELENKEAEIASECNSKLNFFI